MPEGVVLRHSAALPPFRCFSLQLPSRQKLASVPAHEFALSEDVALHGLFDIGLRARPFQGKFRIECVELEKIPVRLPRWRTRATISFFPQAVGSLLCAGRTPCSIGC